MAEELQGLLEKIQRDGVEKAQTEAGAIIDAAKEKAATILADAEKQAEERLAKAEQDAALFESRAQNSLLQAARDLVITVGQRVTGLLERLLAERVKSATGGTALADAAASAIKAYIAAGSQPCDLAILLSDQDKNAVEQALNNALKEELAAGLTVAGDHSIVTGFKVTMQEGKLTHDFSDAAVSDALASLLRPALAQIVRECAASSEPVNS